MGGSAPKLKNHPPAKDRHSGHVLPYTMRMTTDLDQLARAAARGDEAAFAALTDRIYDRTFGLCFRLTGSRAEAEDLTHDLLIALPRKLPLYRGQSRFTTWLYRVTLNAAHDHRRKQATRARAHDGWGDVELMRRAEAAQRADEADWLTTAMRALPDDLRDTLALTLDDATHAEAAQVLGISEGTVSWRLSEARKRLRAIMEDTQ